MLCLLLVLVVVSIVSIVLIINWITLYQGYYSSMQHIEYNYCSIILHEV